MNRPTQILRYRANALVPLTVFFFGPAAAVIFMKRAVAVRTMPVQVPERAPQSRLLEHG